MSKALTVAEKREAAIQIAEINDKIVVLHGHINQLQPGWIKFALRQTVNILKAISGAIASDLNKGVQGDY